MALVKYNNNSISAVTSAASIPSGALTLIKTLTASSSSTLSFVHGSNGVVLDSTYPIYVFKFIDIHPAAHSSQFQFNLSIDSGSNYNVTKTTTYFSAYNEETGNGNALAYQTAYDLAQSTSFQTIMQDFDVTSYSGSGSGAGTLQLFNPSSTTFVKHFISKCQNLRDNTYAYSNYCAGYGNTTSAVNAIQFKMSSGNIDVGKIKLYGIKDS